ncbi:hypothetical protein Tco_0230390 [Tanacetum coccineum]
MDRTISVLDPVRSWTYAHPYLSSATWLASRHRRHHQTTGQRLRSTVANDGQRWRSTVANDGQRWRSTTVHSDGPPCTTAGPPVNHRWIARPPGGSWAGSGQNPIMTP